MIRACWICNIRLAVSVQYKNLDIVGFEVLTEVVMKSTIFWDITPCSPLNINRRFGGTYCLQPLLATCFHAGFLLSLFFSAWRWRRYVPPKLRLTLNGLHGVIFQKLVFFNLVMVLGNNASGKGTPNELNCCVIRTECTIIHFSILFMIIH
jgi:hypothetical protein